MQRRPRAGRKGAAGLGLPSLTSRKGAREGAHLRLCGCVALAGAVAPGVALPHCADVRCLCAWGLEPSVPCEVWRRRPAVWGGTQGYLLVSYRLCFSSMNSVQEFNSMNLVHWSLNRGIKNVYPHRR